MKKEDLWNTYVGKNPSFDQPDALITMPARALKKLFDQTYDVAHTQGVANGRALAAMEAPPSAPRTVFEQFFGGR